MKEPRARNKHKVSPLIWRKWKEDERVHFNKVYDFATLHPEMFVDTKLTLEEWRRCCYNFAILSTDIMKRGKDVQYWRRYG